MEILQHEDEGLDLALAEEQALHRIERELAALGRLEAPEAVLRWQGVKKPENGRDHVLECLVQGEQMSGGLGAYRADVVTLVDTEIGLQEIDDRKIAGGPAIGGSAGLEDPAPRDTVGASQLVEEAGLAHARLAHDGRDLAVTAPHPFERSVELLHLCIAPDEAAQAAQGGGVKPCSHLACSDHVEDLDGGVEALDRHGAEGLDLHEVLGQAEGFLGDPDGARGSELLHAGGQMGGLANGRVVHPEVRADGADHDLSGVQPNPNPDRDTESAERLFRVTLHQLLHAQGGVTGPHGMVLVGDGRPEQRHDPVAHHLVHGSLVAVDSRHHALEHRVEELARLLGIAVGQELHRALEVRKQHRHLLALAFQRASRGEDLLGQVLGRVNMRDMELRVRTACRRGS